MSTAAAAWTQLSAALLSHEPACAGDPRFISDGRTPTLSADLAAVCATCPILAACRAYATTARPHTMAGFWGGRWRGKPSQHE